MTTDERLKELQDDYQPIVDALPGDSPLRRVTRAAIALATDLQREREAYWKICKSNTDNLKRLHARFVQMADTRFAGAETWEEANREVSTTHRWRGISYSSCAHELSRVIAGETPPGPGEIWGDTK